MTGVSCVYAALRARDLKRHTDAIQALPWLKPDRFEAAAARIQCDIDALPALLARVSAAIESVENAARRLRLPQATLALRVAALALAALRR